MNALKYRLVAQAQYGDRDPITLEFYLENHSTDSLWVLKWYTPLEGLKGKILSVICRGIELPYQGPMMKRGTPKAEDYVEIPTRGEVHAFFDLATCYELSAQEEYQVSFKGVVHDMMLSKPESAPSLTQNRSVVVPGDSVQFRISNSSSVR